LFDATDRAQIPVFIVSHKTQFPYLGPKYDLHEAALAWLTKNGVVDPKRVALPPLMYFSN